MKSSRVAGSRTVPTMPWFTKVAPFRLTEIGLAVLITLGELNAFDCAIAVPAVSANAEAALARKLRYVM